MRNGPNPPEHYKQMTKTRLDNLEKTFERRFWDRVNKLGPIPPHRPELGKCWEWTGYYKGNYGNLGRRGERVSTHRLSWEMANGPILNGLFCLHKCDNQKCVNPSHLFLGTTQENTLDRDAKGRQAKGSRAAGWGKFGVQSPKHKLTDSEVSQAIAFRKTGMTQLQIAKKFGVHYTTIGAIFRGQTWPHIPR